MLSAAASHSRFPPHPQAVPGQEGFRVTFLPSLEAAGLPTASATRPFAGIALNSRGWLRRGSAIPCFHLREDTGAPVTPRMSPTSSSCGVPRKLEILPKRHKHTRVLEPHSHTDTTQGTTARVSVENYIQFAVRTLSQGQACAGTAAKLPRLPASCSCGLKPTNLVT